MLLGLRVTLTDVTGISPQYSTAQSKSSCCTGGRIITNKLLLWASSNQHQTGILHNAQHHSPSPQGTSHRPWVSIETEWIYFLFNFSPKYSVPWKASCRNSNRRNGLPKGVKFPMKCTSEPNGSIRVNNQMSLKVWNIALKISTSLMLFFWSLIIPNVLQEHAMFLPIYFEL